MPHHLPVLYLRPAQGAIPLYHLPHLVSSVLKAGKIPDSRPACRKKPDYCPGGKGRQEALPCTCRTLPPTFYPYPAPEERPPHLATAPAPTLPPYLPATHRRRTHLLFPTAGGERQTTHPPHSVQVLHRALGGLPPGHLRKEEACAWRKVVRRPRPNLIVPACPACLWWRTTYLPPACLPATPVITGTGKEEGKECHAYLTGRKGGRFEPAYLGRKEGRLGRWVGGQWKDICQGGITTTGLGIGCLVVRPLQVEEGWTGPGSHPFALGRRKAEGRGRKKITTLPACPNSATGEACYLPLVW